MSTLIRGPFTPGKPPLVVLGVPTLRASLRRRAGKWSVTITNTDTGKTVTQCSYPGALSFSTACVLAHRSIITNTVRLYLTDLYGKEPR